MLNHSPRILVNLVVLFAGICAACGCSFTPGVPGSGVAKSETRQVAAFTKVRIEGSADVTVTVNPNQPQSLSVTTDDNLLPIVQTTVNNGELLIDNKQSISTRLGVKIVITVAQLDSSEIGGSGNIVAHNVAGKQFHASVSGSGDIRLDGSTDALDASISGSGDIDSANLTAKMASVTVTGSGSASVNAVDTLNAQITGSGDIRYSGSPKVSKQITGSGSVRASGK